jgi:hypothetical protein
MQSSVIIEGVTREEFLREMGEIKAILSGRVQREEYTTHELAQITGYSRSHLRVLIKSMNIPYQRRGKDIVVGHQYLGKFKTK